MLSRVQQRRVSDGHSHQHPVPSQCSAMPATALGTGEEGVPRTGIGKGSENCVLQPIAQVCPQLNVANPGSCSWQSRRARLLHESPSQPRPHLFERAFSKSPRELRNRMGHWEEGALLPAQHIVLTATGDSWAMEPGGRSLLGQEGGNLGSEQQLSCCHPTSGLSVLL